MEVKPLDDKSYLIEEFENFKKQRSEEYLLNKGMNKEKVRILQNILFRYIELPNVDYYQTAIIRKQGKKKLLESERLLNGLDEIRNNSIEQGIPIKTLLVNEARLFQKTKNLWVYGSPLDYFSSKSRGEYKGWYLVKDENLLRYFKKDLIKRISDNQETIDEESTRQEPDLGVDINLSDFILNLEENGSFNEGTGI